MSLRTAARNARLTINYGLAVPIDSRVVKAAPCSCVCVLAQPSQGLHWAKNLLSNREKPKQEPNDGIETKSHDRGLVEERLENEDDRIPF